MKFMHLALILACMSAVSSMPSTAVLDAARQHQQQQHPHQDQELNQAQGQRQEHHQDQDHNLQQQQQLLDRDAHADHPQQQQQQQQPQPGSAAPDYSLQGPFTPLTTSSSSLDVPLDNATCSLRLHLTIPRIACTICCTPPPAAPSATTAPQPLPLLLLLSGFQMPASYYTTLAHYVASWGYVVLQYDLPGLLLRKVVRDDKEIAWLPELVSWVQAQAAQPGSALHGAVDVDRIAVMGHSRGAKLAALILAGDFNVSATVLVDPVDMTDITRKMGYPSAVAALRGRGATAAVIGAGISGKCNPVKEGFQAFWEELGPGSWRLLVPQAGHMQFTDAAGAAGWALDLLCGSGALSHQDVISLAAATSVAWLQSQLRPGGDTAAGLQLFQAWVQTREAQGIVVFDEKPKAASDPLQLPQLLVPLEGVQ